MKAEFISICLLISTISMHNRREPGTYDELALIEHCASVSCSHIRAIFYSIACYFNSKTFNGCSSGREKPCRNVPFLNSPLSCTRKGVGVNDRLMLLRQPINLSRFSDCNPLSLQSFVSQTWTHSRTALRVTRKRKAELIRTYASRSKRKQKSESELKIASSLGSWTRKVI